MVVVDSSEFGNVNKDNNGGKSPTKRDQYLQIQKNKCSRQREISKTKKLIRVSSLNVSNILTKIVSDTERAMRKLFLVDEAIRMKLKAFSRWKHETNYFRRRGKTSLFHKSDVRLIVSEQSESPNGSSAQLPSPSYTTHSHTPDRNKLKPRPKNSLTNLKSPSLLIEKIHGPYDFGSYSSRQLASNSSDSNLIVSHAQAVARRSPKKSAAVKVSPAPPPPPPRAATIDNNEIAMTGPWDVNINIVDNTPNEARGEGGLASVHIPMTHTFKGYSIRGPVDPPQISAVGGEYAFSLCSGSISTAPRREARTLS